MHVLVDESLPRPLAKRLVGHEVEHVQTCGWAGLENGDLLRAARAAGFEALLTADRNLEFQQNIRASGMALVVVLTGSNRLDDLLPMVPQILVALGNVQKGSVIRVGADARRRIRETPARAYAG